MRLADFIRTHRAPILAEWEAFARTCAPAAGPMDVAALRDHADAMLTAFAADLDVAQGPRAQAEKSKGRGNVDEARTTRSPSLPSPGASEGGTAAGAHGSGRAASGFSMQQMVAEYRALRASVIRLWTESEGALGTEDIEDLTRFNEAVDQALAESVAEFEAAVEQAKETFLAILGHDLRTPLGAIQTSAAFLVDTGAVTPPGRPLVTQIGGSARRAMAMVGELLDFTRSRLGGGIPVVREALHLGLLLRDVVAECAAARPAAQIHLDLGGNPEDADADGALVGWWDAARLSQALGNLLDNAVRHGAAGGTVTVTARGAVAEVTVAVHNAGTVIPADQLDGIFNPMKARATPREPADRGPTGSLGLGLYIAERIVVAHAGHVAVESSEAGGTTFTVHLPRGGPPTAGSRAGLEAGT